MNIKALARRVEALEARYPAPPTLEQFREDWKDMDELSRSIYELALSCPGIAEGRYWNTIKNYLPQIGVQAGELLDLEALAKNLKSDD